MCGRVRNGPAERHLRGVEFVAGEVLSENAMSGTIEGKVVEVSEAGDLVTDISSQAWGQVPRDNSVRIQVDDEHETFGIFPADHDQPSMTLIAIGEPEQALRLHLVGDSASMMLGVRRGAPVKVVW